MRRLTVAQLGALLCLRKAAPRPKSEQIDEESTINGGAPHFW